MQKRFSLEDDFIISALKNKVHIPTKTLQPNNNKENSKYFWSTSTLSTNSSSAPVTVLLTGGEEVQVKRPTTGYTMPNVNNQFFEPKSHKLSSIGGHKFPPNLKKITNYYNAKLPKSNKSNELKFWKTKFWIDRLLFYLGVVLPVITGICMFIVHSFFEFITCKDVSTLKSRDTQTEKSEFISQACKLKLTQRILSGELSGPISLDNGTSMGSLQHECFSFILFVVAILNGLPHYVWKRCVRTALCRDLSMIAKELHIFRSSAANEMRNLSYASLNLDSAQNSKSRSVPVNFLQKLENIKRNQHNNTIIECMDSLNDPSIYPCIQNNPSVCSNGILDTYLLEKNPPFNIKNADSLVYNVDYDADIDLSTKALYNLPNLQTTCLNCPLNLFLASWQNTDFYWRRFLAKHVVLGIFSVISFTAIVTVTILTHGAPFAGVFHCQLPKNAKARIQFSALHAENMCLVATTFALNMVVFLFGVVNLISILASLIFLYYNFSRKRVAVETLLNCGTQGKYVSLLDRQENNFFCDFIRILSLARMQSTTTAKHHFILRLGFIPSVRKTDFHFISLMCLENFSLFPDASYLHRWLMLYVILSQTTYTKASWNLKRCISSKNIRTEDLTSKLGFTKVHVRVDIWD